MRIRIDQSANYKAVFFNGKTRRFNVNRNKISFGIISMKKGFVFGKFYPFHNGHKAMIDFALSQEGVENLTVMVCIEKFDLIRNERVQWIRETYQNDSRVEVIPFYYDESEYPSTSEADKDISKKWSEVFIEWFKESDYEFFVSSEPYGEYIEEYTGFKHILYDINRNNVPISGTEIRGNVYANWEHLPLATKRYFHLKVCLLGTESTGKTVLSEYLAKRYKANLVRETGRDIVQSSETFTFDDLDKIVKAQTSLLQNLDIENYWLTILDTNLYTTISYGYFQYGKMYKPLNVDYTYHEADLNIYLSKDIPFVQDGTRFDYEKRNRLDRCHRYILSDSKVQYEEIYSCSYGERKNEAVELIDNLIRKKSWIEYD